MDSATTFIAGSSEVTGASSGIPAAKSIALDGSHRTSKAPTTSRLPAGSGSTSSGVDAGASATDLSTPGRSYPLPSPVSPGPSRS